MKFLFWVRMRRLAGALVLLPICTRADTIGYWQFGEGDVGTVASSIKSEVHQSKLIGAASGKAGGSAPVYSDDVPGRVIRDGKDGNVLNQNNTSSLAFTGGNKSSGGIIAIRTEVGDEAMLQPQSFTMEAFVKTGANQLFGIWFAKGIAGGASSWSIGQDWRDGDVKIRADNMSPSFTGFKNPNIASQAAMNKSSRWHHIALTYDQPTTTFTFFEDYKAAGKLTLPPGKSVQYDNGDLTMGNAASDAQGSAYTGLIDEVRMSDKVLTPDQFLRAE